MENKILFSKNSNRYMDDNGYLHVDNCILTSQQVNEYRGREIKDWESITEPFTGKMGLDAETKYGIFRPLEEIKNAIATYNNLPMTDDHVAVTPERPPLDKMLGWSGSNAKIDGDDLVNDMHIFVGKGINDILQADNDPAQGKKELSCGYAYDIVEEKGTYKGVPYQFKMTNLRGNHVALVKTARVTGSQIADAQENNASEIAKKIIGIAKDANYEGREDDQVSAILKAAIELSAIQEREQVHSANDSINGKGKIMKKSGVRIFMDALFGDGKECMPGDKAKDTKMSDAELEKAIKEVSAKDASEFEGGAREKGKTIMEMASKLGDSEKEDDPEEKGPKAKDNGESEGGKMVEEANKKTEVANKSAAKDEEEKEKKQAEDMALDAKVHKSVAETLKVFNTIAAKSRKIVGELPDSLMMDGDAEKIVDYTLKLSGQNFAGKSLESKLAMFEVLETRATPKMVFDSTSVNKVSKAPNIFNLMKGN